MTLTVGKQGVRQRQRKSAPTLATLPETRELLDFAYCLPMSGISAAT